MAVTVRILLTSLKITKYGHKSYRLKNDQCLSLWHEILAFEFFISEPFDIELIYNEVHRMGKG